MDAEATISKNDVDGEISAVFETSSTGKYQLLDFPSRINALHSYSRSATAQISSEIDTPFNRGLDSFFCQLSSADIKNYSTEATGSLDRSGNTSTMKITTITLAELLELDMPLGQQLQRKYAEFKKLTNEELTYDQYKEMSH